MQKMKKLSWRPLCWEEKMDGPKIVDVAVVGVVVAAIHSMSHSISKGQHRAFEQR